MNVVQLLVSLPLAPDVEVVIASLPEVGISPDNRLVPQTHLPRDAFPPLPAYLPRHTLFQNPHHHRRISFFGLAHKQMNVLRHHYESDEAEIVAATHLIQNLQKAITRSRCPEQRLPAVATAGDEMPFASAVASFQTLLYRFNIRPPTRVGNLGEIRCGSIRPCP